MVIEQTDHLDETVGWVDDHEIEVARHSAGSQDNESHAAHEHRPEAKSA